jgi:hypothetical protein
MVFLKIPVTRQVGDAWEMTYRDGRMVTLIWRDENHIDAYRQCPFCNEDAPSTAYAIMRRAPVDGDPTHQCFSLSVDDILLGTHTEAGASSRRTHDKKGRAG